MDEKKPEKKKLVALIGGGVALVVIVVIVLVCTLGKKEEAYRNIRVSEVTGTVLVNRDGMKDLEAYANMNLLSGDEIVTEEGARLALRLDGDKYVILDEQSKLTLHATGTEEDSMTTLRLEYGAVFSDIKDKLSESSGYEVVTPVSTMSVRGTQFEVVYREGQVKVLTYEGAVYVVPEGADEGRMVSEGQWDAVIETADGTYEFEGETKEITIEDVGSFVSSYLEEEGIKFEENVTPTETPEVTETPAPTEVPAVTSVPTESPEPTATPSSAPTASLIPTATPSPKPTATPSPAPTASPKPTATPSPAPTASPKPTATPSPAPTASPEPTATPSPAPTASPKPTATPSPVPTATLRPTPPTPVPPAPPAPVQPTLPAPPTPSPVPTATPSPIPTATPVPMPTATPSPIPTATPVPMPTATPSPIPTATPTPTATPEPEATETPTPEPEVTETPTPEPEATETPTPEPEVTETPTPEPEATETPTPEPEVTITPTPEPEATETPTPEPEVTITPTPEPEATETPTPEPEATETPTPEPEVTITPTPEPEATETPTPEPEVTITPTPEPEVTITPTPVPEVTETPSPTPTGDYEVRFHIPNPPKVLLPEDNIYTIRFVNNMMVVDDGINTESYAANADSYVKSACDLDTDVSTLVKAVTKTEFQEALAERLAAYDEKATASCFMWYDGMSDQWFDWTKTLSQARVPLTDGGLDIYPAYTIYVPNQDNGQGWHEIACLPVVITVQETGAVYRLNLPTGAKLQCESSGGTILQWVVDGVATNSATVGGSSLTNLTLSVIQ